MNYTPINEKHCPISLFMLVKILQKDTLLKKCCQQMRLCLFMLMLKLLNSLTRIDAFCCRRLSGLEVPHQTAVQDVPCSIPSTGKDVYAVCFVVVFLLFCPKHISWQEMLCNCSCNVNSLSILNIHQYLWPIIRVSK